MALHHGTVDVIMVFPDLTHLLFRYKPPTAILTNKIHTKTALSLVYVKVNVLISLQSCSEKITDTLYG